MRADDLLRLLSDVPLDDTLEPSTPDAVLAANGHLADVADVVLGPWRHKWRVWTAAAAVSLSTAWLLAANHSRRRRTEHKATLP